MTALVCYEPAFTPGMRMASQMWHDPPVAPKAAPSPREFHEVWEDNFDVEFNYLLAAVSRAGGPDATIALDMEFPGFLCEDPRFSSREMHYQALRRNVDQMWPIQLGLAVASSDGVQQGIWTFNLRFDARVDAHTEESLTFLRDAGIDFPRHRSEGINVLTLGHRLVNSTLVGSHGCSPCWLTFSGSYDWAYLCKLASLGRALPTQSSAFEKALSVYCPRRRDLRDLLPTGSLEKLGRKHGVKRWGSAHTAGSDALLTSELYILLDGHRHEAATRGKPTEAQLQSQWAGVSWNNSQEASSTWYSENDQWYADDLSIVAETGTRTSSSNWESDPWAGNLWGSHTSTWYAQGVTPLKSAEWKSAEWYPDVYQTTWYATL